MIFSFINVIFYTGTFAYAGGQFGTVVTMPISGFLAGSSIGWPSIFYIFGSIALLWSITFYFMGFDSPVLHPSISHGEKLYIQGSLGEMTEKTKLDVSKGKFYKKRLSLGP